MPAADGCSDVQGGGSSAVSPSSLPPPPVPGAAVGVQGHDVEPPWFEGDRSRRGAQRALFGAFPSAPGRAGPVFGVEHVVAGATGPEVVVALTPAGDVGVAFDRPALVGRVPAAVEVEVEHA